MIFESGSLGSCGFLGLTTRCRKAIIISLQDYQKKAELLGEAVCNHWVLNVAFREDDSRLRKGHGPENFAVLRHIALNLLKQEGSKLGVKAKKGLKPDGDSAFLGEVLAGL